MTERPDRHDTGDDLPALPGRVGGMLDRVVRSMGAPGQDAIQLVFGRWDDVVGSVLGARTRPLGLADGTLRIAADDPATASHVRYLEAELVERLTGLLGTARVGSISVVVDRPDRRRRAP